VTATVKSLLQVMVTEERHLHSSAVPSVFNFIQCIALGMFVKRWHVDINSIRYMPNKSSDTWELVVVKLSTVAFVTHYHSYLVESSAPAEYKLVHFSHLIDHHLDVQTHEISKHLSAFSTT